MNFIVSSGTLLKELQALSGIVPGNPAIPILSNFLFRLEEDHLIIRSSDLETTIETMIKVQGKGSGSISIPAKVLLDTLKSLPEQPLTFHINTQDNLTIEISSDFGKYKLVGYKGEDFPMPQLNEEMNEYTIQGNVLARGIDKTLFATANDNIRPIMSGVLIEIFPEMANFVATDAHKLVRYRRNDVLGTPPVNFVLSKTPLTQLKNLLSNFEEPVKILVSDNHIVFEFSNKKLIAQPVEGKYPDYEKVIPRENPNKLIVDREAFLGSIKRVSLFANKANYYVLLFISGNELTIRAEDDNFSYEAQERLTCQYEGHDMKIGFNSRFLIDILNHIETEQVVVEMSEPSRAALILPHENVFPEEDMLMLLMPIMFSA
jgi:DNA polymerase-3 subunit beta